MGLCCFQGTGFDISYFPGWFGNLDHINIKFGYHDDGISLLDNQSLIKLRDWLSQRNVSSVAFNIFNYSQRYNKLNTPQYHQLAKKLGELFLNVSTIKKIYIDEEAGSDDGFQPYKEAFKTTLTKVLETSLAHPSLIINVRSGFANELPSYTPRTFSVDYPDKRTFGQKFYNFVANIPFLWKLIRFCTNHAYREKVQFEQILNNLETSLSQPQLDSAPSASLEIEPATRYAYQPLYTKLPANSSPDLNITKSTNSITLTTLRESRGPTVNNTL